MNINNDQENLSAEQSPPREETRIPGANGDQKRTRGDCAPPGEGTQTFDAAPLLKTGENDFGESEKLDFALPKHFKLRKPAEFQLVYKNGKRFDQRFVSAFVLPNNLENHRLGITASRKAVGNAVQRNRAKRLLREAFRLSKVELNQLTSKYDFVLNARRNLLKVKMQEPLADFHRLILQIKKHESGARGTAVQVSANNANPANVNQTVE